jgi:aspartyl-tRNA(Asn)/glutamyl-tRNA(Gln) amidotransferase subunit B
VLTADVALADYFDGVVAAGAAPKAAANWVTGEFRRLLNQNAAAGLRASGVALPATGLAEVIAEVEAGRVSVTNAKAVLAEIFDSGESPRAVIEREGLGQVSDAGSIGKEVEAVLAEFPEQVAEYRAGKQQIYGFLVGQVMKRTAGRADARLVNDELRRRLAQ